MRKVFWDDPYQQVLVTKVLSVDNNYVVFESTIAFSFAGGQESDSATVNELPLVDSRREGNLIVYTLEQGHGLRAGDEVTMKIDWPRRYKLMRLHFAAELILELVTKKLGLEKIGAHIAELKARIDFVYDKNISSIFEDILSSYNRIIDQDLVIKKDFSDVENQRRFWEIEGFSKVPCGGTHVRSTAEVGFVTLKRKNVGGSKERIEIALIEPDKLP
jgi:Ser-tRNA(Ala) deacylase AlaX